MRLIGLAALVVAAWPRAGVWSLPSTRSTTTRQSSSTRALLGHVGQRRGRILGRRLPAARGDRTTSTYTDGERTAEAHRLRARGSASATSSTWAASTASRRCRCCCRARGRPGAAAGRHADRQRVRLRVVGAGGRGRARCKKLRSRHRRAEEPRAHVADPRAARVDRGRASESRRGVRRPADLHAQALAARGLARIGVASTRTGVCYNHVAYSCSSFPAREFFGGLHAAAPASAW